MTKDLDDHEMHELNELTESVKALANSLLVESERAAVILAAARLDADLELILKRLLVPHPGGTDPLFEGDRMLGTFSAKIALAYRLGAIDAGFEHAMQILRKIRNDFAHQLDQERLSTPRQKGRIQELTRWAEKTTIFRELSKLNAVDKSKEHVQFIACTVCMTLLLQIGAIVFRPIKLEKSLSAASLLTPTS